MSLAVTLIRDGMIGFAVTSLGSSQDCVAYRVYRPGQHRSATKWLPRSVLKPLLEAGYRL